MNRLFTVTTCWLAAVWMAQASAVSLPDYSPGDIAAADIIAPFEFAVVNTDQTERLRQQELEKVPAIYRFNPWVAVQAEEKFSMTFSRARAAFLEAMEIAARKRPLDEATVAHPSFWRFVDWFKEQHPNFPLTTNLATMWALGESDDKLQFQLQSCLRDVGYVRSDTIPPQADTAHVRLVAIDNPNARLSLREVSAKGEIVPRTQILTLSEARAEIIRRTEEHGPAHLEASFDPALTPFLMGWGKFLGAFLVENLLFDDWLTAQKRHERAAELIVFDQYSPGQLVLRAGQVVDSKAKAALGVMAEAVKRQQTRAAGVVRAVPSAPPIPNRFLAVWTDMQRAAKLHPWLIALLTALAFGVCCLVFYNRSPAPAGPTCEAYTVVMNPSRNETVFLPVSTATGSLSIAPPGMAMLHGESINTQWQVQLREAEQRAEDLLALVRAGLAPHLAKELTHKLVQELVSQRATLLRAHQLAEQEILSLEARFEKIYRELHERVSAYERRNAELEKELISKSEQTRELLNATILLTQQKLEQKQAGDQFACN